MATLQAEIEDPEIGAWLGKLYKGYALRQLGEQSCLHSGNVPIQVNSIPKAVLKI